MINSSHKIFISYKYHDSNVYKLKSDIQEMYSPTTVRDYVNKCELLSSIISKHRR